jgi:hypothetical protein
MSWQMALSRAGSLPHWNVFQNVGASLLAKALGQTLKMLRISPEFPAPAQRLLGQPYPWSSTH